MQTADLSVDGCRFAEIFGPNCHRRGHIILLPRGDTLLKLSVRPYQGGYIFYAGASLASAGYCRQCRRLPAILPLPTAAGLPGLCENFRPTTSKSSPILHLLSSHWATSVVRTRVVGVANVGDSLRRLSSLQHRIYNLLGLYHHSSAACHCGGFAAERRAGRKHRSTAVAARRTVLSSKCEQCHVVS